MRDTVGKYIPEGIGVGIEKGERSMLKSADHMNKKLQHAVNAPDIDGTIGRTNGRINSTVRHELGENSMSRTDQLLERLANASQTIVLDSGALVGGTYKQYDRVGGNRTQITERWGR